MTPRTRAYDVVCGSVVALSSHRESHTGTRWEHDAGIRHIALRRFSGEAAEIGRKPEQKTGARDINQSWKAQYKYGKGREPLDMHTCLSLPVCY